MQKNSFSKEYSLCRFILNRCVGIFSLIWFLVVFPMSALPCYPISPRNWLGGIIKLPCMATAWRCCAIWVATISRCVWIGSRQFSFPLILKMTGFRRFWSWDTTISSRKRWQSTFPINQTT